MIISDSPARSTSRGRTARPWAASVAVLALGATTALAVTPAAFAATEPVLPAGAWVDQFDTAELGSAWDVVNPVPSAWSLATTPGSLTLTSQTGDTYQEANTAKNVFMVDVPVGDFTVVTKVSAPVGKVYQGAGLIAWKDMDNYVRAGLTYVGSLSPSARAIELDNETGGKFTAASFTDRAGSTGETLRMQRTGDTLAVSYWDATAGDWKPAGSTTVTFDVTQVGLYALAAQDGSTHAATFDYVAVDAAEGQDVVPTGTFSLDGPADHKHLVLTDTGLSFVAQRPASPLGLVATAVAGGPDGAATLAQAGTGLPVVVASDGRITLGAADAAPAQVRLTDVGGGKLALRVPGAAAGEFAGVRAADGALVLGAEDAAVRLTLTALSSAEHTLAIDAAGETVEMSDDLYGIFYEDINYAADGGLYAELVRNRSFEFNSSDNSSFTGLTAWERVNRNGGTATTTVVTDAQRLNDSNRYYLRLDATAAGAGVRNAGFNTGLFLEKGQKYDFTVWARSAVGQDLTVQVENAVAGTTYATGKVTVDGTDTWKKYSVTLTATETTSAGRLAVLAGAAGTVRLDMVSLMPQDTWVGPVNGKTHLRKDLAEKIDAMNPQFLRFPGGCVTNAGTFDTYLESNGTDRRRTYQWKETIGPVEERATNWNFWGYNQSYGIGYYEYFTFAEDLGATPLPVLSVGANGCGSTIPEMKDDVRIQRWVQDTLDLIEFANGDVTTEWGAVRAELGHPEPFGLKYLGLGNEENTKTFEANFPKFKDAVRAAYPDVQIISNSGPDDTGQRFDELWEFNRAQEVDLVDEHYYNDPSWFLENADRYDDYDREGPHVFLGEYASRGNTFFNALSEAAFMTGLERNSDVVELASYAPLLSNESYVQWSPDAIWFDNDESWGTPNYYVQELFANNVGDEVVPSVHTAGTGDAAGLLDGGVFLSTWSTSASYDNVKVTDNASGDVLFQDGFDDATQWSPVTGTWAAQDGVYTQSSTSVTDARSIVTGAYAKDWKNYTLELDARKIAGSEGFLVGFAAGGPNDYYWWNIGGWNNTRSVLQRADGGSAAEVAAVENKSIETGQGYKVKVVVQGSTIELYLDGQLQISYEQPAAKSLYQVVTRDEESGDLVVKVVNPTATAADTAVTVAGQEIAAQATVTEMVGAPTDTNTKANPRAIVPVERTWDGASNAFDYTFPAYSVTFLRLQAAGTEAEPVDLAVTAKAQCVAGRANLSVRAVNGEDEAVTVAFTTPFGTKTFASVAPGKSASQSFSSRAVSVPAGTATVVGTIGTGPGARSTTFDVEYPATTCG
ncbi:alpha-L-arabinofuranosidase C-terminal domain-containing protein [Oerskovia enterophila]|uniref:non-reducing end alpha-L-arabinofuranosidase n=1 Tax=Oerskovia enterophila TaxID=43678 RepID=A0A163SD22_9CELL|nr:alpha-L-arabinofuranosidase C-terminal domain-containing protein [Oerskovia enterophila]KZM36273.1 extracellular exo-alpha-L-arabinofuranosidase precursor [Oerskovia enterophila]